MNLKNGIKDPNKRSNGAVNRRMHSEKKRKILTSLLLANKVKGYVVVSKSDEVCCQKPELLGVKKII
jgi:hypothetical protein